MLWIARTAREGSRDPVWQARLTQMAQRFGISRAVRLCVVAPHGGALAGPMTAGWWRPVVLVPAALMSGMPPDLLEALLAHELAHVRRHDYLVNLLQNAIEILLFYHPAVWWLSRRIRAERELIADDLAAAHSKAPRRLAQALSELEKVQFSAPAMAMQACGGDLAVRIRRLVQPQPARSDWKALMLVLGLATAGLFGAAHATGNANAVNEAQTQVNAIVDFSTCAKPEWSQPDLEAGHTGTVHLRFLIAPDGSVTRSQVLKSSGYPGLDQAARVGIEKCHFKASTNHGKPVASWVRMQYIWVLE
jgi:bla regulator protein BlaR1